MVEELDEDLPARKTVRTKTGRGRKLVRHQTEVAIPAAGTTRGRTKVVRRKATASRRFTRPGVDGLHIASSPPKRASRKRSRLTKRANS